MRLSVTILFALFPFFLAAQKIDRVHFEELVGGVMLIKAQVDNKKDTLNFIFDSGSTNISLDSMTALELGIPVIQTEFFNNGVGGRKPLRQSHLSSFKLGKINLDSIKFNVNDYQILTESFGVKIDGIVGYRLLNQFIFKVNFDSSYIDVFDPNTVMKYPRNGYMLNYYMHRIPYRPMFVEDERPINANFYIDCGAGLGLLFSEQFVKDSGILLSKRRPVRTQVDGVGGSSTMRLTVVKKFKLGNYTFKNVPTYLFDDEHQILPYPGIVGLLGNDILRRFNWILDYKKNQLHLTPNKNYGEKFDYTYTGLGVYTIDGFVTITDIVPESPGAKAGFKEGDLLISIGGNVVNNVKRAKELLQQASGKTKVIVIRKGKPLELILKPLRIK